MARTKICKIDGCDEPVVPGTFMCLPHSQERRRCEGRVREIDPDTGEVLAERRCKKAARPGLTVCRWHGGSGPRSEAASSRTAALSAMQRFVKPYEGDLDPISAFEAEFRRTYGRIQWLEGQLGALEDERDLIWGQTKEERVNAAEFAGTNKTYEARIHVYEEMLRWERKHFLEMEKIWIKAGLEEKKLNLMRDHITYTYSKVLEAARALGFDPHEPETRDILMRLFTDHADEGGPRAIPTAH